MSVIDGELEVEATMTVDQGRFGMSEGPLGNTRPPTKLHVKARLMREEPGFASRAIRARPAHSWGGTQPSPRGGSTSRHFPRDDPEWDVGIQEKTRSARFPTWLFTALAEVEPARTNGDQRVSSLAEESTRPL